MRCLVTGGAGFIGSNLALELEKKGHEVVILDNLSTGTRDNLEGFKGIFLKGDVVTHEFKQTFDAIFHQAAITDPRYSDDKEVMRQNVGGFRNMLELARKNKAKFVYASTANLYGNGPVPMKESQKKDLTCAYGRSKLMMDEEAEKRFGQMHIVGLRYFNIFGPHEANKGRAASMILHLAKQMKAGKAPRIFKLGEQKRDHIYVKDVVDANLLALNAPSGIYNAGTGVGTSFNELVEVLNRALGTELKPEYIDMPYDPKTYQLNTQANTDLAQKKLKFKALYSLQDGIKNYLEVLP
ncbi:MAG: NAD-dependent epimerase/dehydratase family protein [Nanoarchaeota archaeon]|nr:NAD-dependent epimerase/dehydratase family protein [Nanoarchaeota archaeon]